MHQKKVFSLRPSQASQNPRHQRNSRDCLDEQELLPDQEREDSAEDSAEDSDEEKNFRQEE